MISYLNGIRLPRGIDESGALVSDLDAGGNKITGLGAPSAAGDAATKAYVDANANADTGSFDTLSGRLLTLATATAGYLGFGSEATTVGAAALKTPVGGARNATALWVKPVANGATVATTYTLYKNGVATTITLSVAAGSTTVAHDGAHTVAFADGDGFDVRASNAGAVGQTAGVAIDAIATVVWS